MGKKDLVLFVVVLGLGVLVIFSSGIPFGTPEFGKTLALFSFLSAYITVAMKMLD
jgi:hypothetical protein